MIDRLVALTSHRGACPVAEVVGYTGAGNVLVELMPELDPTDPVPTVPVVELVPRHQLVAYSDRPERVVVPELPLADLALAARDAADVLDNLRYLLDDPDHDAALAAVERRLGHRAARLRHAVDALADVTEVLAPWESSRDV